MATLARDRRTGGYRPKPTGKESKVIHTYADTVHKKSGGANQELVNVYKAFLGTQKKA
jgi:hypothetical protein